MHEQMDNTPVYELYFKAMAATTEAQAEAILSELITRALAEKPELGYAEAKAILLSNIGYFTGYLKTLEEQRRVLALYQTEHPIFGSYDSEVTPEKALLAGMAMGAVIREGGPLIAEALQAARKIIEEP
jgi:hypothetical protein